MTEAERKRYSDYYMYQAGSGLDGFSGYKYQRGHGFFGSLFRNILKPLGIYLGKQALSTGVDIGKDLLQGENIGESFKKRGKQTVKRLLDDSYDKASGMLQKGKGKRRRRQKITNPKKIIKRVKRKKRITRKRRKPRKIIRFGKLSL